MEAAVLVYHTTCVVRVWHQHSLFFPEKTANSPCIQTRLLICICLELRLVGGGHRPLGAAAPNSCIKLFSDTEIGTNFQVIIPSLQEVCLEKNLKFF